MPTEGSLNNFIRLDLRVVLHFGPDDTNGTSLTKNLYPFYVYVKVQDLDIEFITTEHIELKPRPSCFITKCSIAHVHIIIGAAAKAESQVV